MSSHLLKASRCSLFGSAGFFQSAGREGRPADTVGWRVCGTPLLAALWPLVEEEPTEAEPERVSSSAPSLPVDDVDSRDLD